MNESYWSPMVPELIVSNFEKSLKFYTTLCGFTIRYSRETPSFAYLEREKVHIMIEENDTNGWITGELTPPLGRGVNFQMEFTEIQSIHVNLQKNNVSLFQPLKETWYEADGVLSGQEEFLVQDPDGYLLRFVRFLGEKELE